MNRRMTLQGRTIGRAAGFTLVELLVVVVIIAILAGMAMAGLAAARNAARERKTWATITKLNNVVLPLYDAYRNRRVPLSNAGIRALAMNAGAKTFWDPYNQLPLVVGPTDPIPLPVVAAIRLAALRDIMRMELPERPGDITNGPYFAAWGMTDPSLHRGYAIRAGGRMGQNGSAECLYMIVSMAAGEEAREQFAEDEVGDTDGNGLFEFLDGWGRPIDFLRWAPGFNQSDVQQTLPSPPTQAAVTAAAQYDHDPFDPRRVDVNAFRLVPLIYSAGSDGQYHIYMSWSPDPSYPPPYNAAYRWSDTSYHYRIFTDPGPDDPPKGAAVMIGTPYASGAFDNIHNHRLEVR